MFVAISPIDINDVAGVDTIYVALDDFNFVLSFVIFNVFIFVVGVVVGVDNSFPITVTVAVVAFAVDVDLAIIVACFVFLCRRWSWI